LRIIDDLRWRPKSTFTSAIRKVRGSAVPMRHQWSAETVLSEGNDLSAHSQVHLNKVARQLNERPRETCYSKPQQRDLTPVLRRSIEPAESNRTYWPNRDQFELTAAWRAARVSGLHHAFLFVPKVSSARPEVHKLRAFAALKARRLGLCDSAIAYRARF